MYENIPDDHTAREGMLSLFKKIINFKFYTQKSKLGIINGSHLFW